MTCEWLDGATRRNESPTETAKSKARYSSAARLMKPPLGDGRRADYHARTATNPAGDGSKIVRNVITECTQCGQPLLDNIEYCPQCKKPNPFERVRPFDYVPLWGWPFIILTGAVPAIAVLSGGALAGSQISAVVGIGAAYACARTIKNPNRSIAARLARCVGFTVGAWSVFLGLGAIGIWGLLRRDDRERDAMAIETEWIEAEFKLPRGASSPEGIAADLARSSIHADRELFDKTCLQLPGNTAAEQKYRAATADLRSHIQPDIKLRPLGPGTPIAISRIFRSRPLSTAVKAEAAAATFGLIDVRFVDLELHTFGHGLQRVRTLVAQQPSRQWRAIPVPQALPSLSLGLSDEAESTEELK
jgi:hypothetical protein